MAAVYRWAWEALNKWLGKQESNPNTYEEIQCHVDAGVSGVGQ